MCFLSFDQLVFVLSIPGIISFLKFGICELKKLLGAGESLNLLYVL